jgi:hypothetical protein
MRFPEPAELRALEAGALGELLARTGCVAAFGGGEPRKGLGAFLAKNQTDV